METTGPGFESSGDAKQTPGQKPSQTPQQKVAEKKLQQQQAEVSAVMDIMRNNVDKVIQRDMKVTEVYGRAEDLEDQASEFEKRTDKLKRKFWWKNCKMLAILIGIGVVIIVVILVWAVSKQQ